MKKQKLTAKQCSLYDFIVLFIRRRGYPPTLSDVTKNFGLKSKTGPRVMLEALEDKGWIERDGTPRGIRVL